MRSSVIETVLPFHRLPPGYRKAFENPPDPPVEPRPAATLALIREGTGGLEVLLLRRTPRARFIPGAFVFPGGRVDRLDASEATLSYLTAPGEQVGSGEVRDDLSIHGGLPDEGEALSPATNLGPHLLPFVAAALRETQEETGILLGNGPGGEGTRQVNEEQGGADLLKALRAGEFTFPEVLKHLGGPRLPGHLPLIGHWVTPVQERYRYDTRFFAAQVPPDCQAVPDGRELVEAVWLTPEEALGRNREGKLPMVFPTVATLETLRPFSHPAEALEALDRTEVPRLVPTVEETKEGIRMRLDHG